MRLYYRVDDDENPARLSLLVNVSYHPHNYHPWRVKVSDAILHAANNYLLKQRDLNRCRKPLYVARNIKTLEAFNGRPC